ncbi:EnoylCoA hydratase/isomerase family domain containing protein [Balamuthia mandrillaris]
MPDYPSWRKPTLKAWRKVPREAYDPNQVRAKDLEYDKLAFLTRPKGGAFNYADVWPHGVDPPPPLWDVFNHKGFLPPVLADHTGRTRHVYLNSPYTMNSLEPRMISMLATVLRKYEEYQPNTTAVGLSSSSPDNFSAGTDFKSIYEHAAKGDINYGKTLLRHLYQLNYYITGMTQPYFPVMNGISMGSGAALVYNSNFFRITTEQAVFALPEVRFGFVPDCGASWFFPAIEGHVGLYLALTGKRLKGWDIFHSQIATHVVPSDRLEMLWKMLADTSRLTHRKYHSALWGMWSTAATPDEFPFPLREKGYLDIINRCFSKDSVAEIITALSQEFDPWARKQAELLRSSSPLSLCLTFRAFREGAQNFREQSFRNDFRIASRLLEGKGDLMEGIEARLVQNREPKWKHKSVEDVTESEVNEFFQPLDPSEELYLVHREHLQLDRQVEQMIEQMQQEQYYLNVKLGKDALKEQEAEQKRLLHNFPTTAGLSPEATEKFRQLLEEEKQKHASLLSSHAKQGATSSSSSSSSIANRVWATLDVNRILLQLKPYFEQMTPTQRANAEIHAEELLQTVTGGAQPPLDMHKVKQITEGQVSPLNPVLRPLTDEEMFGEGPEQEQRNKASSSSFKFLSDTRDNLYFEVDPSRQNNLYSTKLPFVSPDQSMQAEEELHDHASRYNYMSTEDIIKHHGKPLPKGRQREEVEEQNFWEGEIEFGESDSYHSPKQFMDGFNAYLNKLPRFSPDIEDMPQDLAANYARVAESAKREFLLTQLEDGRLPDAVEYLRNEHGFDFEKFKQERMAARLQERRRTLEPPLLHDEEDPMYHEGEEPTEEELVARAATIEEQETLSEYDTVLYDPWTGDLPAMPAGIPTREFPELLDQATEVDQFQPADYFFLNDEEKLEASSFRTKEESEEEEEGGGEDGADKLTRESGDEGKATSVHSHSSKYATESSQLDW